MSNLTDFIQEQLYPSLFERIGSVFTDFKRTAKGWQSSLKLDGTEGKTHRKDKTVITNRKPGRALEQGGDSVSLVDLYGLRKGISTNTKEGLLQAVEDLCSICGLELPKMADSESYRAYKEKQDKLEALAKKMAEALYSDEAKPVLSYLKESRGYDDGFISYAQLGFVSPSIAKDLNPLVTYQRRNGETIGLPYGVGDTFTLAIPYVTGGSISGFVFRRIGGKQPKYIDAFISYTATKRYHLFGLTGLHLTGNEETDKDITIVEGELDALRASYAGVKNVVAASGGVIAYDDQTKGYPTLTEAKRRGVKRITLLFDTEDTDKSQETTYEKTAKAIKIIQENGLTALVCNLPSNPGQKQDADSYLKTHTGADLAKEISKAQLGGLWLYERIRETFANKVRAEQEKGGYDGTDTVPPKLLDEFKRQTIQLCNDATVMPPTQRGIILNDFANYGNISVADIQEEADRDRNLKELASLDRDLEQSLSDAAEALKKGNRDKAISLLKGKVSAIEEKNYQSEFEALLPNPTKDQIQHWVKDKPIGIPTDYSFGQGDKEEQLIIPSGALTFVCAPTSHGKSTMLRNLTLQMVRNSSERGAILYFTFEEEKGSVFEELENTYIGETISRNNLKSIRSYHTEGKLYRNSLSSLTEETFKAKEKEFMSLFEVGKIRLYSVDFGINKLTAFIRYLHKNLKLQAVCIDYMQFLRKEDAGKQPRNEELKAIGDELNTLAKETGLPIILAAQLNRDAKSPIEMHNQNIADAADIERIANTVILLWNSSFLPTNGSIWALPKTDKDGNRKEPQRPGEQRRLEEMGFTLDRKEAGRLYAVLSKNRGGSVGLDTVLNFDGNTGRIAGNYIPKEEAKVEPQQQLLPLKEREDDNIDTNNDLPF